MTPQTPPACSCPEYGTSRRAFLTRAMAVGSATVATTMFGDTFRQTAYAATNGNVLVVLSLRGGCDGLSLVVPHGDPAYAAARPSIAVPTAPLLGKDTMFGLHPALKPLESMWTSKKLTAIHATGLQQPNRSHFSAIEAVEDADAGSSTRTGWINRLIGLDTFTSPVEAVTIGSGVQPSSMYGPQPTLSALRADDIELSGANDPDGMAGRRRALNQVWGNANGTLAVGARSTLTTTATIGPRLQRTYTPANGATYPQSELGRAMSDTARLIKAQVGVEVVTLDYGSWDMHSSMGTLDGAGSTFNGMAGQMALALKAFFTDLGTEGNRVTLVTLTEFGRRLHENGARGLDHGWANATLLMGAGVNGGKYYGTWPGLDANSVVDGDLAVTTDYRSVLSEILVKRFNVSTSKVFPSFIPEPIGAVSA
ncbi:MAG: DUF1501 domain-containing protein [Nocardioidaceae bacterium]|nr:DUF1501 domain-containing protein [Nocardioidaceae bacterium]